MPNPTPLAAARDTELDEALSILLNRRDNLSVVRIVEAWSSTGTPSLQARLAEARAFYELRLMDRALSRTREVLDAEPENAEALRLLARVYLERGWPARARKPLQQLRDAGEGDTDELWARAHAEPVRPEVNAREIEREGNPTRLLALAEGFLATGSFLRATGILERLRRAEPENGRIKELLWALAGDFSSNGQTPEALLAAALPPTVMRDSFLEEPEHTESLDLKAVDLDPETAEATAFPALFKHAASVAPAADDPHEQTQSSGLASTAEMQSAPAEGDASQLVEINRGADPNDTQIMLVLRPGEERPNQIHKRKDGPDNLRNTLNLRAWQESMGMSAPAGSDLADAPDDDLLEEEDENVVVMTRGESGATPEPAPPTTFSTPIEVIEKHATPITAPPAVETEAPTVPPVATRRPQGLPGWVVFGAVGGLILGILFLAVIVFGGLAATSQDSSREELLRALAQADYNALLTQEGRLEQRVAAGEKASEVADLRAALTETRLVLWSDFNGDPVRIQKVREAFEHPERLDAHRVALLRAEEALARRDVTGARAAIGRESPADDEERLLFARIAAGGGEMEGALAQFASMSEPSLPRYRLARAEILAAAGRVEEARGIVATVLQEKPDHVLARTLEIELSEPDPKARVAAVSRYLDASTERLAPRFAARLELVRARAWADQGMTAEMNAAVDRGLSHDGTNAELLVLRAARLAEEGKLSSAQHELETAVTACPGAAGPQAANVLVLLDLDRVDAAEAAVNALEKANLLPGETPVLANLVAVVGRQVKPTVELLPPQRATPLGATAVALAAAQDRVKEAEGLLDTAISALEASSAPFERRLAPRLRALKASVVGPPAGDALAEAALDAGTTDPAVHVYLGRYYEGTGQKLLAAQHFDRAVELGPEFGLAWYEKGRFYLDARDNQVRSGAAWRRYMTLAPSGPRARSAKDTLGLR